MIFGQSPIPHRRTPPLRWWTAAPPWALRPPEPGCSWSPPCRSCWSWGSSDTSRWAGWSAEPPRSPPWRDKQRQSAFNTWYSWPLFNLFMCRYLELFLGLYWDLLCFSTRIWFVMSRVRVWYTLVIYNIPSALLIFFGMCHYTKYKQQSGILWILFWPVIL